MINSYPDVQIVGLTARWQYEPAALAEVVGVMWVARLRRATHITPTTTR